MPTRRVSTATPVLARAPLAAEGPRRAFLEISNSRMRVAELNLDAFRHANAIPASQ